MLPSTAERPRTDIEKIVRWRAECLCDAGLRDIDLAQQIADKFDVDIHQVCRAITHGATEHQLALIFL